MPQTQTHSLAPAIFDRNLSALEKTHPLLADRFSADAKASAPPLLAKTRDGKVNFRLAQPDGSIAWFGRTSIPAVRAAALLTSFKAGNANVLLPGIGEGTEACLLTRQLSPHRAVFVWEPSESSVGLALRLHDVAQAITDERLIFLTCALDHLTGTLVGWLDKHPGHLCPNRIMMWPWQQPGDLVPCRSAVEIAYGQIEQRRSQALAQARRKLSELTPPRNRSPLRAGPTGAARHMNRLSVPILALHARDETWALANALANGGAELGWHAKALIVRTPADVHALARMTRLVDHAGGGLDAALLLDVTRHEVRDIWPEHVPVISWLSPTATIDATLGKRIGNRDSVVVTSSRFARQVMEVGIDERRISVFSLPCLVDRAVNQAAEAEPDGSENDRPLDVLVMANLAPTDPESFGHCLPTHMQVWNNAVHLLKGQNESFTDDKAEKILARAEEKSGTRIDDATTRQTILQALGTAVAETLLWRLLTQVLVNNGVRITVYGNGWMGVSGVQSAGSVPSLIQRGELFRRAKIVVYADVTGAVSPDALLAAGKGAVLLARRHPEDDQPGGLTTLLEAGQEMVPFSSARELVSEIRRLLQNPLAAQKISVRARNRCRADHTPASRLQHIWASLDQPPADYPS